MNTVTEEPARAMEEGLRTVERDEDAREDLNQWLEQCLERYFSKAKMKRGMESSNALVLTEKDRKEFSRLEKKLKEATMWR